MQSIVKMFMENDIFKACKDGDIKTVKKYIKDKRDVNAKDQKSGLSLLHIACMFHHLELVELLLDNGANINSTNNNGSTPLHIACKYNFEDCIGDKLGVVELLLKKNIDFKIKNKDGMTALHMLCRYHYQDKNVAHVYALIKYGSHVNEKDNHGTTPLHYVCDSLTDSSVYVELLVNNGANVNAIDNNGMSPLHYACNHRNNNANTAVTLINNGACVDTQYDNGYTCLHQACINGNHDMVIELLKHCYVNCRDNDKNTPLHYAIDFGYTDIVKTLQSHGSIFVENKYGITANDMMTGNNFDCYCPFY